MIENWDRYLLQICGRIETARIETFVDVLVSHNTKVPTYIWTLNLSHLRQYLQKPDVFDFLEASSLVVADGWPVKILTKRFMSHEVFRIPGVDLVSELISRGVHFGVIGSQEGQVMSSLELNENASISQLDFVFDSKISENSDIQIDEISKLIKKSKTKFVFIALGFPKQEFLFKQLLVGDRQAGVHFLGIGGSFEMLSAEKIRAPKFIQNWGLEWAWRLAQDPRRLARRYLHDLIFFVCLLIRIEIKKWSAILREWMKLN